MYIGFTVVQFSEAHFGLLKLLGLHFALEVLPVMKWHTDEGS